MGWDAQVDGMLVGYDGWDAQDCGMMHRMVSGRDWWGLVGGIGWMERIGEIHETFWLSGWGRLG